MRFSTNWNESSWYKYAIDIFRLADCRHSVWILWERGTLRSLRGRRLLRSWLVNSPIFYRLVLSESPSVELHAVGTSSNLKINILNCTWSLEMTMDRHLRCLEATFIVKIVTDFLQWFAFDHIHSLNLRLMSIPVFRHRCFVVGMFQRCNEDIEIL